MILNLLLPYPLSANEYWRHTNKGVYVSSKAKLYRQKVFCIFRNQYKSMKPFDGLVKLNIVFHPKKNKDGSASARRLDLDNVLKITLDALNGLAYVDDKQIINIVLSIGNAVENGGLSVSIALHEFEGFT